MDALPPAAWQAAVVSAQGRTVPATETPWMRSREVLIHVVDLDAGLTFADLPADFLAALRADITAKRGADNVPDVRGRAADITAYLAGRPYSGVTTPDGAPPPELPPWL
jgi:maleylpyruvate isomerase